MKLDKTCVAFYGTPMWDWLKMQEETDKQNIKEQLEREEFEALPNPPLESCCHDPETCVGVDLQCVVHPECGGRDTVRTSLPDEENVSEFWCYDCGVTFTASNP